MIVKQRHSRFFARFVMGLLLCAWTNVFAQPCLMPVDSAVDGLPDVEHGHMLHEMHAAGSQSADACGHCASADEGTSRLCAAGLNASCGESVDTGPDRRKAESKFKFSVQPVSMHTHPGASTCPQSGPGAAPIDPALLKYDSGPPLSVRFCVYLK